MKNSIFCLILQKIVRKNPAFALVTTKILSKEKYWELFCKIRMSNSLYHTSYAYTVLYVNYILILGRKNNNRSKKKSP